MSQDVIIIGAPRSGTNMLRDVLVSRPGVTTWPCDEINAIWRHNSRDHPTDEIPVERATARQGRFVRSKFERQRRRGRSHTVVEKTCANSLRVEYVAALLPDARFVFITRHGADAAASAMRRWTAPLDLGYSARKARFVPASDLMHRAEQFYRNRIGRSATGRVRTWGPRFASIDEMVISLPLDEVCAIQWRRCVDSSRAALRTLPADRVHHVVYEDFVAAPTAGLRSVLSFLALPTEDLDASVARVSDASVGKGRATLDGAQRERVDRIVTPALVDLGYA